MKKLFLIIIVLTFAVLALSVFAPDLGGGIRWPPVDPPADPQTFIGPYAYVQDNNLIIDGALTPRIQDVDGNWVTCSDIQYYEVDGKNITFYFGSENFTIESNYDVDVSDVVFDVQTKDCGFTFTQTLNDITEVNNLTYNFPLDYETDGYVIKNKNIKLDVSQAVNDQGMLIVGKSTKDGLVITGPNLKNLDPDITFSTSQTICGTYAYDNIIINNSAVLTVCKWDNTTGLNGTVNFQATTLFSMDNTSNILLNGSGYYGGNNTHKNGYGPGFGNGTTLANDGAGGGYGGYGGNSTTLPGGAPYGNSTNVTDMGSGGGYGGTNGNGGAGGGYLLINSTGTVIINGTINVNGKDGTDASYSGGGGAGGGVWIIGKTIQGSGFINATGGSKGGTGSGGRVLLQYCTNNSNIGYSVIGGKIPSPGQKIGENGTYVMIQSNTCFPSLNSINITPSNPNRNSNLSMFCNYSSTGTLSSINWSVYKNQVLNQSGNVSNPTSSLSYNLVNISSVNTSYGQNWTLSCSATDDNGISPNTNFTVMINDTVPLMTGSINITPNPATKPVNLTCNNGTISDPDGDSVTVYRDWLSNVNVSNVSSPWVSLAINNINLNDGNLSTNISYECRLWIGDGILNSTNYTSNYVMVGGPATPTINSANVTSNGIISNSTNPTNNNATLLFSINWTSNGANNNGTLYICKNGFAGNACDSNGEWCHSDNSYNETRTINCSLDISTLPLSSYSWIPYIYENTNSVYGGGVASTFGVNHPPTVSTLTNNPSFGDTTINIVFSATDPDAGDTINNILYIDNGTGYTNISIDQISPPFYQHFFYPIVAGTTYNYLINSIDNHGYGFNSTTFSFTVPITNTPPGGGGGGIPIQSITNVSELNITQCGDGKCTGGETLFNCAADCSPNIDQLISGEALSWPGFTQSLFYIIIAGIALVVFIQETGGKRKR